MASPRSISKKTRTCGPCHPDANCIHSSAVKQKKSGRVLKDVSRYKNPEIILRVMEASSCSQEDAEMLFEEAKQYLARSAVSSTPSSPSKEVDVAWHEFILFTRDYQSFCQEYFGKFIHHVPTPRLNATTQSSDCEDCAPLSNCESSQVGDR